MTRLQSPYTRGVAAKKPKPKYDCSKCPGYCCTYETIPVRPYDLRRMAKGLEITVEQAKRRYTKPDPETGGLRMRHRQDDIFPTACMNLDQETRRCKIYEHRPKICRDFPDGRCGYFDFMMWEREQQDDDEFIPVVS